MEKRKLNIIINRAGGNAGSKSLNYKISIPSSWAAELGITKERRQMIVSFDGKKIIIEKMEENEK